MKAYAVTALMKIYSFEIAAGKKVDILPEVVICNSFGTLLCAQMHTFYAFMSS